MWQRALGEATLGLVQLESKEAKEARAAKAREVDAMIANTVQLEKKNAATEVDAPNGGSRRRRNKKSKKSKKRKSKRKKI